MGTHQDQKKSKDGLRWPRYDGKMDKSQDRKTGGLSTKNILKAFKMAIVPTNFRRKLRLKKKSDAIQKIIVGEILSYMKENTTPKFQISYLEKGALLIKCVDQRVKKWLLDNVYKLSIEERLVLKVDIAMVVLRTTKVLVKVPKRPVKRLPEQFVKMMKTQTQG